jgi:microcystin-dependent protein
MKLKLVVVDFEAPRWMKRWALRLGVPIAILAVAGVALAATLKTWSAGDTLTAADLNSSFQAVATPPGTIVAWGGAGSDQAVPAGWILCDGRLLGRTGTYGALFSAISITFGGGDGVTTFKIPDLRGYFLRGLDTTGTVDPTANRTLGSIETDSLASHSHPATHLHGGTSTSGNQFTAFSDIDGDTLVSTAAVTTQPFGGAETRPRNVAVNYIIKY